jgi:hypothetical protein
MCKKSLFSVAAAVLAGVALATVPAGASIISPSNGSFELPAFDAATNYAQGVLPADWQATSQNTGNDIIHHPSVSGLYADAVDGIAIVGLESQYMSWGGIVSGGIRQDLGTMAAGEKYTFNATLYSNSEGLASIYRISFYNVTDGHELAAITETNFDPSALGTNKTIAATFSYTADAADQGDTLRLIMNPDNTRGTSTWYGWGNRTGVDNVTVTTTPEPGTMVLCGSGLFGLLCYAWRRRR